MIPESKISIMEKAKKRKLLDAKRRELRRTEQEIVDMMDKSNSLPSKEKDYYSKHINDAVERMKTIAKEIKRLSR